MNKKDNLVEEEEERKQTLRKFLNVTNGASAKLPKKCPRKIEKKQQE